MSNHNRGLIIFIILAGLLFMLIRHMGWSYNWLIGLSVIYLSVIVYASLNIDFNYFIHATSSGDDNGSGVAITFDDGPSQKHTSQVLDILKSRNVKATFFCIGKHIQEHTELIGRMHKEGHILGNHSYAHNVVLDFLPASFVQKDINRTNDMIADIIGETPLYYRPPFGVTTPAMARAINRLKMTTIGWNNRSFDTSPFSDKILLDRIDAKLKPGCILLLHDVLNRQQTLLPAILDLIEKRSLRVIPLDELINKKAYA